MMDIQPLWVCKISLSRHIGRDHKKKKKSCHIWRIGFRNVRSCI
jgi:hypothetical protein